MKVQFGKLLGEVAGRFHLYQFLSKIGIEALFYRMCYKEELKQTEEFFSMNSARVKAVAEMFVEEKSRTVYQKAVNFRQYHRLKFRPPFCPELKYYNSLTPCKENEVFIDCGAWVGDSAIEFAKYTNDTYRKIVSFEPDDANFEELKKNVSALRDCIIFKKGVWSSSGRLSFQNGNSGGSQVIATDQAEGLSGGCIDVVQMDEVPECQNATFIKLTVEGSELAALQGARNLIIKNRPILTMSIYHTPESMLSIPEWLRDNLTRYRFFCRHHSYYKDNTIMYAIPEERYS